MKKPTRNKDSSRLEGEGSYSATRNYNAGLRRALAKQDTEGLAEKARRALEGPEGPSLKRAESIGKRGRPVTRRRAPH